MSLKIGKSGKKVGNNDFAWFDVEMARLHDGEALPMVTMRRNMMGGAILARVIATRQMAKELREVADEIDRAVRDAETEARPEPGEE